MKPTASGHVTGPLPDWLRFRSFANSTRWISGLEYLLLAILIWRTAVWCLDMGNWLHQADFTTFYVGAWQLAHGLNPYTGTMAIEGTHERGNFVSPPWFALMMAPLTLLPTYELAAYFWLSLNILLLGASIVLAIRLSVFRPRMQMVLLFFLALFLWKPVVEHLLYGQNTLLVSASILLSVRLLQLRYAAWAGVVMVIAGSKPQLIFLLGLGLAIWEWRQRRTFILAGSFIAVFIGVLVLCLLINSSWLPQILHLESNLYDYWTYTINARTLFASASGPTATSEGLYLILLAVGSAIVLYEWWRSGSCVYLTAITLCATLLLTPYTNIYDYVLLILPLYVAGMAVFTTHRHKHLALFIVALLCYAGVMANDWLLRLFELEHVWNWFQGTLGEEGTNVLWVDVKWTTRFLVMIVPLILIGVLVRYRDVISSADKLQTSEHGREG